MAKTQTKTYRVLNPRGIEKGVHILRHDSTKWHEDDDFTQPASMPDAVVADWVKRGFLEGQHDG